MKAFQSGGATIHYEADIGSADAQTLVFVNSLGTDFRIWDGVLDALGGQCNVVRHDKRGHGLSALGDQPIAISTYADDVENLLKHLGARNIIVVGISVGGLIAQNLLQRKSIDIKGVVLSNSGLKIGDDAMWNSRMAGILEQGLDQISHGVMERWFSPDFRAANPETLSLCRTMLSRSSMEGYLACCRTIRDAEAFDHRMLHRPIPCLCIGGSLDGSTPPEMVQAMAATIAGAGYVEFAGAGHLPCIEQPAAYAGVIVEFVSAMHG